MKISEYKKIEQALDKIYIAPDGGIQEVTTEQFNGVFKELYPNEDIEPKIKEYIDESNQHVGLVLQISHIESWLTHRLWMKEKSLQLSEVYREHATPEELKRYDTSIMEIKRQLTELKQTLNLRYG